MPGKGQETGTIRLLYRAGVSSNAIDSLGGIGQRQWISNDNAAVGLEHNRVSEQVRRPGAGNMLALHIGDDRVIIRWSLQAKRRLKGRCRIRQPVRPRLPSEAT